MFHRGRASRAFSPISKRQQKQFSLYLSKPEKLFSVLFTYKVKLKLFNAEENQSYDQYEKVYPIKLFSYEFVFLDKSMEYSILQKSYIVTLIYVTYC